MTDIVERLNDSLSAGYDSLSAGYSELRKEAAEEIMRLRAKIEVMERQGPVVTIDDVDEYGPMLTWNQHWHDLIGSKLYALPGAKGGINVATD